MPTITISKLQKSIEDSAIEVVERKGIGHPDTLADGIAEILSLEYSKYCLKNFGVVLHHSFDKIMLVGGAGRFGFGVGEMLQPWKLILNGRASMRFSNKRINFVNDFSFIVKKYLKKVVPRLDADRWLKIIPLTHSYSKNPYWFSPRTVDDVPDAKTPYANDTSVAVGYWPLSRTERLALALEGHFYLPDGTPRYDFVGQDIKVLCVRRKKTMEITLCVPFFSKKISAENTYKMFLGEIHKRLLIVAHRMLKEKFDVHLALNTQDQRMKRGAKEIGHYFVISGSALDSGEEGVTGRGNRSRGIISNTRPQSLEGICGKNPVYHVGKVYNYLADRLAKEIATKLDCECVVYVSSRNGDPLYFPHNIFIETTRDGASVTRMIKKIVESSLEIRDWTQKILGEEPFLPVPGGGHGYHSPEIKFL